jgi:L-fuconate dehydratase
MIKRTRVKKIITDDIRYPTASRGLAGSDPRHFAPDYSCVRVTLTTDDGLIGHSIIFTCGAGNEIVAQAVKALSPIVRGKYLEDFIAEPGLWAEALVEHHQLRWLRGIIRMAAGGILNALWDLRAKRAGVPMWILLCSLTPHEIVSSIDWHFLEDHLTRNELLGMLEERGQKREDNIARIKREGLRIYNTAGWSGRLLEEVERICRELSAQGCTAFKAKCSRGFREDRTRARTEDARIISAIRRGAGAAATIYIDSNQNFGDWKTALDYVVALAEDTGVKFGFIEEPIAPDDVLGYIELRKALIPHGIGVAGGEHVENSVIFKQLLAGGGLTHCQIDGARIAGVNELLAVIFLAEKYGVPVCPHSGGIGLLYLVVPLAAFDQVWNGSNGRILEYLEFLLADAFKTQPVVENGRLLLSNAPGWGLEMNDSFLAAYGPKGNQRPKRRESDRIAANVHGAPYYAKLWK